MSFAHGRSLFRAEKYEEALPHLRHAALAGHGTAALMLARYYYEQGEEKEALAFADLAIQADLPEGEAVWGWVLDDRGETKAALPHLLRGAMEEDAECMARLVGHYSHPVPFVPETPNLRLAAFFALRLLTEDPPKGHRLVGEMYRTGRGFFPRCPAYARYHLERARQMGEKVGRIPTEAPPRESPHIPFDVRREGFFTDPCPRTAVRRARRLFEKTGGTEKERRAEVEEGIALLRPAVEEGYTPALRLWARYHFWNPEYVPGTRELRETRNDLRFRPDGSLHSIRPDNAEGIAALTRAASLGDLSALSRYYESNTPGLLDTDRALAACAGDLHGIPWEEEQR